MTALGARIAEILALDPDARAVEFEGQWASWGVMASARDSLRTALADAGMPEGTRVGLLLRNHVALVPALLALLGSNDCLVTLNPLVPTDKLARDLVATQVPVVVGLASDLATLADAISSSGCLVIELASSPAEGAFVRQHRDKDARHRVEAGDVALEMLTSGTTGEPKRIPMRRVALEKAIFAAARFEKGRGDGDQPRLRSGVQLLMAPFAHIGGLLALMNAVAAGRSSVLLKKFSVEDFRNAVSRYQIKVASAPPAALKMILDADVAPDALASLVAFRTGTAPLDPDLGDAFYSRYKIPVLQNYGATEFGGVAGWTLADFDMFRTSKRGSVGRLNPGVEGRVVDPELGEPLKPDEPGILELRSPQVADGRSWLRTTDRARIDADGFLYLLGRSDNVIIRGGFKVHPDDLVKAAESFPKVREAAVIAASDPRLGQVPVLAVVPAASGSDLTPDDVLAHLRSMLTSYQVPVAVHVLHELPRTPSLKVDQVALAALLEAK